MPRRWRPSLLALLSLAALSCGDDDAPPPVTPPPLVCNGHAELCDRRFDQVAFPATHNSMSNEDEGWTVPNQHHPIGRQLTDGIRVFLIDSHLDQDGIPSFCHQGCGIGSIPMADVFAIYRDFLVAHPSDVLTLIIEDYVPAADTAKVLDAAGLTPYLFVHAPGDPWPTLREMVTSNTRLFVTAETGGPPPAWYHHVWDVTSDTPYTFASLADIDAHGCDPNRGQPDHPLFLVNHWLGNPFSDAALAAQANPYAALSSHVFRCRDQRGRLPNFVAVDFYDLGDLFRVVDELNGF